MFGESDFGPILLIFEIEGPIELLGTIQPHSSELSRLSSGYSSFRVHPHISLRHPRMLSVSVHFLADAQTASEIRCLKISAGG
jgi:hypothetical protein